LTEAKADIENILIRNKKDIILINFIMGDIPLSFGGYP
jgi:hypothetical protein